MKQALEALGQHYLDFQITKYLPIEELQATLIELIHEPSGARILSLRNGDPENLFCLSFQTLPDSSNGAAHILEHTVLCGSKRFPVKDPFFSMLRRSMNTFMNAMTGQDFTCYPAASEVSQDFYNLLDVYLDAVFYPSLKKESFLQEGHRLSLKNGRLCFEGVVYNEMKGAMSSFESRLWSALSSHLTPDLPYAFDSGGKPEEIPNLSYEELLEFHRTFYHPSRCLFFFYGNLPLQEHLNFLSEKVLQGVKKLAPLAPIPLQPRFEEPVEAVSSYPVITQEARQDFIAFSWLTAPLIAQEEILALELLDLLLMDTDASILKKALLKSKLCQDAESSLEKEMSEVPWTLLCRGTEGKDKEKLKKLIFKTLEQAVKTPFSKEEIEAALHQIEFERREIGGGGAPFGLTLFFRTALLKHHGSDPENGLSIHTLFKEIRERLKNPNYLPQLIQKYFLENPHYVLLVLKADPLLETREKEEEQKRLDNLDKTLSTQEKEKILDQSEMLLKYQETLEKESLECLPKISLKELSPHAKNYLLSSHPIRSFNVFHHKTFTNQILYADLFLELPLPPEKDLIMLSLFSQFLTELGAGGKTYEESLAFQQASVGEFSSALTLIAKNPNAPTLFFRIKAKALVSKAKELFRLFSDYLTSADLTSEERLEELFLQEKSALENQLVANALNYARAEALSGHNLSSFLTNELFGFGFFRKMKKLSFDQNFLSHFQSVGQNILHAKRIDLVLSCDEKEKQYLLEENLFGLDMQLKEPKVDASYLLKGPEKSLWEIPSPVAFSVLGMRAGSFEESGAPYLAIAAELLHHCYLHKEIREKGGAYGSGAIYTPMQGNFHLYSFRDPHLTRTKGIFFEALQLLCEGKFEENDLFEAKLSVLQTLDAPTNPGKRGVAAYFWQEADRSFAKRDAYRQAIFKATKEDIVDVGKKYFLQGDKTFVSLLGKELLKES